MALEMQIYSPTPEQKFQSIKWNNKELKAEVAQAMAGYQNLVVSPGTEAECKDLRAKMNKLRTALETARKDMKKRASEPIALFEAQVKEVEQPIDKAIANLDYQLKDIEEQKKAVKKEEIERQFDKLENKPAWLTMHMIFNTKWLNLSYSMNNIVKDMQESLQGINNNLAVIRGMQDIAFEAEHFYSETLDFAGSIKKAKDALEMQRRKELAEAERKRRAEEDAQRQLQMAQLKETEAQAKANASFCEVVPQNEVKKEEETAEKLYTVSFRVELTRAQAKALGDFCRANGIMLEKI